MASEFVATMHHFLLNAFASTVVNNEIVQTGRNDLITTSQGVLPNFPF